MYFYSISVSQTEMTQVFEILCNGYLGYSYITVLILWLLMSWQCKGPRKQSPPYWPSLPGTIVEWLKYRYLTTPREPTRRSENDNTPQPLDQWTNSSFIGQQVGNCKSFTLTHYFADLSAMHRGRRSIPLCIQHHIQLTSLSFQVSQTSHCWVTAISIFYLENPRSRSWVRSKFEVTMWV